ncbi:MAG: excinuclease ABC subunit UvrC [Candidatus Cloacimonetes bacterium]|nr:excinuclease ABC subunit UvrC [Candidatus Cloacimonadota bacterium]
MEKIPLELCSKLELLPNNPGVYMMKNARGKVLYIGKAKSLKNRIRTYFSTSPPDMKTQELVSKIKDFDYIVTNNEQQALILESNLIKKHQPRFNVLLKDDKRYPFIKISVYEPFPRLLVTRELKKDGAKYFGPYTDAKAIRKTLRLLEWIFPTRTCKRKIPENQLIYQRACINFQMGKCPAPCIGKITSSDYNDIIRMIMYFLNGRNQEIIENLRREMSEESANMNFEKAARLRDKIRYIEKMSQTNTMIMPDQRDIDVIGIYREENEAAVAVLKILKGKLLNKEIYPLDNIAGCSLAQIMQAFLQQYYLPRLSDLPYRILLPLEPEDHELINNWLQGRLKLPQRGDLKSLVEMAKKNAFNYIEERKLFYLRKSTRTIMPIKELKDKLNLSKLPRKIACFDISTIQGMDTVSALVFFENGKAVKKNYRRFSIRTVAGQDDFAAMSETLARYLDKLETYDKPDLIIIDGGKGQLHAVTNEFVQRRIMGIDILALAKRAEEIFLPNGKESVILAKSSPALRLLIRIRDEAHRFAITYHRQKRKSRTLASKLDLIAGISDNMKFSLLKEFHSVERIRHLTWKDLISVKGIGEKTAKKIIASLQTREKLTDS